MGFTVKQSVKQKVLMQGNAENKGRGSEEDSIKPRQAVCEKPPPPVHVCAECCNLAEMSVSKARIRTFFVKILDVFLGENS